MLPTLESIARALGGRLRRGRGGRYVAAPGPGCKPKDRSLSVWVNPSGKLGVHSHRGVEPMEALRYVEERIGIAWRPPPREPGKPTRPWARAGQRVREYLRALPACPTDDQFAVLIELCRQAGDPIEKAFLYARTYKFFMGDVQEVYDAPPRFLTPDAIGKVLGLTRARRLDLKICTIGDVDTGSPEVRARERRQRQNEARRRKRAAERAANPIIRRRLLTIAERAGCGATSTSPLRAVATAEMVTSSASITGRGATIGSELKVPVCASLTGRQGGGERGERSSPLYHIHKSTKRERVSCESQSGLGFTDEFAPPFSRDNYPRPRRDAVAHPYVEGGAGSPADRAPYEWRLPATEVFVEHIADVLNTGISRIFLTSRGRRGSTSVHWQIGLAYAEYLSPALQLLLDYPTISAAFIDIIAEIVVGNSHNELFQTVRGADGGSILAHWQIAVAYAKYLSLEVGSSRHQLANSLPRNPVTRFSKRLGVTTSEEAILPGDDFYKTGALAQSLRAKRVTVDGGPGSLVHTANGSVASALPWKTTFQPVFDAGIEIAAPGKQTYVFKMVEVSSTNLGECWTANSAFTEHFEPQSAS